jgi:hypothetical protein
LVDGACLVDVCLSIPVSIVSNGSSWHVSTLAYVVSTLASNVVEWLFVPMGRMTPTTPVLLVVPDTSHHPHGQQRSSYYYLTWSIPAFVVAVVVTL